MSFNQSFNAFLKDAETLATELNIETSFTQTFIRPRNK